MPLLVDGAFDLWCQQGLRVVGKQARTHRGASGADDGFDAAEFEQADLLTVQFADGTVLHTDPVAWADRFGADLTPSRAAAADDRGRVVLPFNPATQAEATRGGDAQLKVESYELSRLTPRTLLDRVYDLGAQASQLVDRLTGQSAPPASGALAAALCRAYEDASLHPAVPRLADGASGALLAWRGAGWQPATDADVAGAAGRVVLLLHGTASSTGGSFSGLWEAEQPDAEGRPSVARDWLDRAGPGAAPLLLAFEHRSLTAGPLRNVLDLLDALDTLHLAPTRAVTLLSHSRGGLVGELLNLLLPGAGEPHVDVAARRRDLLARLRAVTPRGHPDAALHDRLARWIDHADAQAWPLSCFVRVACPARGTLLADRRTDLFLSLLLRAVELAVGVGTPWYARLAGLAKGLVAAKADARQLPGLEAMIPGSPLTVALNTLPAHLRAPGRLRVVAGDAQAQGIGGLLTLLGDLFYGLHDHDYVVHTHAMFGGAARVDARSLRVEDPSVTHFGYFKPGSLTRRTVLATLGGDDAGYAPLAEDEARTRGLLQLLVHERSRLTWRDWEARMDRHVGPPRPILLVLPGIMGSELSASDQVDAVRIWLSLSSLLSAELPQLEIDHDLHASGVMAVAYERLLAAAEGPGEPGAPDPRAAERFHVFALAFDWRRPLADLGQEAGRRIDELLARAERLNPRPPVHVLAHSMGGLVARFALGPGSPGDPRWQRFTAAGGRLLMLGTPNQGSYAPAQLLMRQHMAARLVAMAGVGVDARDLARFGAAYPGLMSMLPHAADPAYGDLYAMDSWARAVADDDSLVTPDPATLQRAREARQWLGETFDALKASDRVLYVAGHAPTPMHLRLAGGLFGRSLRLGVSDEGDGTVPWSSCLGPERTWYVSAGHGDLADLPDAFDGYFELLRTGTTRRLSQVRPSSRGADSLRDALFPLPALPSLPGDPAASVLGVSVRDGGALPWVPPTDIRVVHGSLDYARFPLIVGHYANDGVYGAVARVDEKLNGFLRRQIDLELVTGKAGTATYVRPRSDDRRPPAYPGAIVVGLGVVGELTPAALTDSVTRGVLRYAVEHVAQDTWAPSDKPSTLLMQFSALLVGTHVQALSKRDSLAAVLLGVWRAGQLLADGQALGGQPARITEVELIEIEESVALDAAYALQGLLARREWASRYHWARPLLETRDGGLRGYRPGTSDSMWQRLLVREDNLGGLRFELIAERARVESTQVQSDVSSLRSYIDRVSDEGADGGRRDEDERSIGRVLFQLLLPQLLKTRMANFDRTVVVVDDRTAALPWELLTPPQRGTADAEAALPLSVQGGMVRQRITPSFRAAPPLPQDWTALVVGDPSTDGWTDTDGRALRFAPLPGAADEARRVAELLRADARPWQVDQPERGATFEVVRTALLRRPFRVLHLAGHGVVDQWQRSDPIDGDGRSSARREVRRTGIVLSHQQVLTAADVEQMDPVPEFVFINGCYSSRDGDGPLMDGRQPALLASSLALQFIRMGAKAVVAAGWRVHDGEGLSFAHKLYAELLAGQPFGQAVHQARREVYLTGRTNTWGAYQCYGDPDWRLVEGDRASRNRVASRGSSRLRDAERCLSPVELAERIQQAVQVAGDKPTTDLVRQLQDLEATLQADTLRRPWLTDTRVATAFGGALRELGRHAEAVRWFERSASVSPSHLELRHIELAARSLTRLDGPSRERAHALLQALARIDQLLDDGAAPARPGASVQRATIDGSRLARDALTELAAADLTADAARRAATLLQAAASYGNAYRAARGPTAGDPGRQAYTLANATLLLGMAALLDRDTIRAAAAAQDWLQGSPPDNLPAWLHGRCQDLLDDLRVHGSGAEFWDYTNALELRLARSVLRLAFDRSVDTPDLEELPTLLRRALVRWPSPVELQSLRFNFEAIGHLVGHLQRAGGDTLAATQLAAAVSQLLSLVTDHQVGGGPVG